MVRPASVLEVLAALGFGAAAVVGTSGLTACVGNPAPDPVPDAGTTEDASPEADADNGEAP